MSPLDPRHELRERVGGTQLLAARLLTRAGDRPILGRRRLEAASLLDAPTRDSPGNVDVADRSPDVMQLMEADVLEHGVQHHPPDVTTSLVAVMADLLESERGGSEEDPEAQR